MVDEPLDYEGFTPDQRQGVIDALAERLNAVHAELLRAVLVADRLKDFRADGVLSMPGWLAYRYNLSPRTAGQWVKAAHALDEMPLLREQYVAGKVSLEQLMHALSYAQPGDDAELAQLLPGLSCAQTQAIAQARRKVRARDHHEARRVARFCLRPDGDGLGSRVTGFMPAEDAAYVDEALTRRAEAAGPDAETGLWAPIDNRMAGALTRPLRPGPRRGGCRQLPPRRLRSRSSRSRRGRHPRPQRLEHGRLGGQRHHQRPTHRRPGAVAHALRHPHRIQHRHPPRSHRGHRPRLPHTTTLATPARDRPRQPLLPLARLHPPHPPPPPHAPLDQARSHQRLQPDRGLLAPPPPPPRRRLERHRQRRHRDHTHQPQRPHHRIQSGPSRGLRAARLSLLRGKRPCVLGPDPDPTC